MAGKLLTEAHWREIMMCKYLCESNERAICRSINARARTLPSTWIAALIFWVYMTNIRAEWTKICICIRELEISATFDVFVERPESKNRISSMLNDRFYTVFGLISVQLMFFVPCCCSCLLSISFSPTVQPSTLPFSFWYSFDQQRNQHQTPSSTSTIIVISVMC